MTDHKFTNALFQETSPYLLQHAHNPVDWHAWNEETLAIAKKQNKLLIISIGYSACHWCHVMEHESFEDEAVAQLMNKYFLPIKVDREERPDIDDVYMTACQMVTGRGGWPLNAIALPDGRPVWVGTYFPKERWMAILEQFHRIQAVKPERLEEAAQSLIKNMRSVVIDLADTEKEYKNADLDKLVNDFLTVIDYRYGGRRGAPKFPMPSNWIMLMEYNATHALKKTENALDVTLKNMAKGGIFDHLEGGFARYAVDERWLVPHFEKMLYDNAQLLTTYALAFNTTGRDLYKSVIRKSINFAQENLLDASGGWYAALDADSEGIEGKYYVWTETEIDEILDDPIERKFFKEYYGVTSSGNWEGVNILEIQQYEPHITDPQLNQELKEIIRKAEGKLLSHRSLRVKPGLDDKILTSWNGLMTTGLIDAYIALQDESYLDLAHNTLHHLLHHVRREDNGLYRNYKNGKATINGFLDDYAHVIQACIDMYEVTGELHVLKEGERLTDYVLEHFKDDNSALFFYTSDIDAPLVVRKKETTDNVIPASNSTMALNLHKLGMLLDNRDYRTLSEKMLQNIWKEITRTGQLAYYSNWLRVALYHEAAEVVVMGEDHKQVISDIKRRSAMPAIYLGHTDEEILPLMQGRSGMENTTIYVCKGQMCLLPTQDAEEAVKLIREV